MLKPNTIDDELNQLIARLENNIELYAGYPPNTEFDYSPLFAALKYPINNLGDAFAMLNPFSAHDFEYRVIEWFLELYGLNSDTGWGYVTNCSTEGIFFGLWLAREQMHKPIVYYSNDGHYSIPKAINVLNLPYQCIKTDIKSEIDYLDFAEQLIPHRDAIIVATLGSTMTSSIDDIKRLHNLASEKNCNIYIHADAAIDGMLLPFLNTTKYYKLTENIDSISISGHKIIGSPMPCGVVLTHKHYLNSVKKHIDYVANYDATLSGSRNGFAALILWYAIKQKGHAGFKQLAEAAINRAKLYTQKFEAHHIAAWRYDHAITIVLDQLPTVFLQKWRMPSNKRYSTLTALPKLKLAMIEEIIEDILTLRTKGHLSANQKRLIFPDAMKLKKL